MNNKSKNKNHQFERDASIHVSDVDKSTDISISIGLHSSAGRANGC